MAKVTGLRVWRNGEIINARDYVYERNLITTALNTNDDTLIDHENRLTQAEADIVSLDGRLDVAEADIDELQREEHLKLDFYGKAVGNLAPMDIVMFAGVQGDHILMTKADVNSVGFKPEYVIGMVETAINNGDFGRVRWFGLVENVPITENAGSLLWLSQTTPGAFTTSEPTSGYKILVAAVEKQRTGSSSNGEILIRPSLGSRLEDLHNTNISVTPTGGDILLYENGEWINSPRLVTLEDAFDAHIIDLDNPHQVTQSQVGLSNVNNTSDLNKPISTATQAALDLKADLVDGKVPANQLPSYVDDVIEVYVRTAATPLDPDFFSLTSVTGTALTPESGKIYMVIGAANINLVNTTYRWGGTHYAVIGDIALGTTAATAFPGDRGLATETKTDNIVSGVQGLTNTRITNSAIAVVPTIINALTSTTADLQQWQVNSVNQARIDSNGNVRSLNLSNPTLASNARVNVTDTGTQISRNIADANPSLIVNQANAGSTGDILRLQFAGANKLEITKDGFINQNGTRLFHQTGGSTNTFFGASSGSGSVSNVSNSGFGQFALQSLTSGISNTALGRYALGSVQTSSDSTGVGTSALINASGGGNTAVGRSSGNSLTTGTNNLFLGYNAGNNASQLVSATNSTALGNEAYTDKSNQMVFGNASVSEFVFNRNTSATMLLPNTEIGKIDTPNTLNVRGSVLLNTMPGINQVGTITLGRYDNNTNRFSTITSLVSDSIGSNYLRFNVHNGTVSSTTNVMTLLGDGKVGIGTGAPARLLSLITSANQDGIQIRRNSSTTNDFATIGFRVHTTEESTNLAEIRGVRTNRVAGFDTDLTFHTFSNFVLGERMRIRDDGNVGIGITNPTVKLDVNGTMRATSVSIESAGNGVGESIAFTDGQGVRLIAGGSERIRITEAGLVGIGTSAPATLLSLRSSSDTYLSIDTNLGAYNAGIRLSESSTPSTNGAELVYDGNANLFHIKTGSSSFTERLTIVRDTGLVGIGETSPTAQLQVKSGATNRIGLIVDSLTGQTANLQEWRVNGSQVFAFNANGVARIGFIANASSSNNANIEFTNNGAIIRRNINDANPALIVNLENASATGNIQVWQFGGSAVANINRFGSLRALSLDNVSSTNNSRVFMGDTGTTISRNIADSNSALIVNQANASSTGNLLDLQAAGTNVISFKKDGTLLAPTTFTIDPSAHGDATGKVIILGDLQVDGTTTTINSTTLEVDDKNIELSKGAANKAASDGAGISIDLGTDGNATLTYGSTADAFTFNKSLNAIDTRITNSAIGVQPLIVNGISGTTTDLQRWQVNGATLAGIDQFGIIRTEFVRNLVGSSRSVLNLDDNGAIISRNIADANHALRVNLQNAGSTGDILRLQFAGANKLEITKDGFINQNGTRLFHQTAGNTNTFFGNLSGNLTLTGTSNTAYGSEALDAVTSGGNNTAVGRNALGALTTGGTNVGVGSNAFLSLTTGEDNTSVGTSAGRTITTGGFNTFLGAGSGFNALQLATATNSTAIGNAAYTDKSNQMVFGNASVSEFVFNRNTSALVLMPQVQSSSSNPNFIERTTTDTNTVGSSLFVRRKTSGTIADGFSSSISFQIDDTSNSPISIGVIGSTRSGANNSGRLIFQTNNAGSNTEKMTIMPDGKVGIGTSSPVAPLQVATPDATAYQRALKLGVGSTTNGSGSFIEFPASTSDNIGSRIGGGREGAGTSFVKIDTFDGVNMLERFRITANGLVGINETSFTTNVAQLVVKSGATNRVPLIVDTIASNTADLQVWRNEGSQVAFVNRFGSFRGLSLDNLSSSNNSRVFLDNNGTTISRNINDTNPALIVNLANASATANIQVWQKAGVAKAHITNNGGASFTDGVETKFNLQVDMETSAASDAIYVYESVSSNDLFYVQADGDAFNVNGTYGTISDIRLKENIIPARNYIEDLMKLNVVKYSFKKDHSDKPTHLGFIAQEFEQVFPNLVETRKTKELDDQKQIKMSVLIPMLVKVIQEQQKQIDELIKKVG